MDIELNKLLKKYNVDEKFKNYKQNDACYELMEKFLNCFREIDSQNFKNDDVKLLYSITNISAGNLNKSIENLKELIKKSSLVNETKILEEISAIKEKIENKKYYNVNGKRFGLFNSARAYHNDKPANDKFSTDFIKLCICLNNIKENKEDITIDEIKEKTKEYFKEDKKSYNYPSLGMAGFSQIFHCINPYIFPVLNGGAKYLDLYFGNIKIESESSDKADLFDKYFTNCEKIYNERKNNYSDITNYRVFDYVARLYSDIKIPLNQILYGPPGTGKTYNTIIEAMRILGSENVLSDKNYNYTEEEYKAIKEEFEKLKKANRIEFITFHQSYSYEEFVEGIKPVLDSTNSLKYDLQKGIFKQICERAEPDYKNFKTEFDKNFSNVNITEKIYDKFCSDFTTPITLTDTNDVSFEILEINDSQGCNIEGTSISKDQILGKETGNNNNPKLIAIQNYIKEKYKKELFLKYVPKYVLIIDEINRGNISKIFGELITLIEPDKRLGEEHEITVKLPYSSSMKKEENNKSFGVPSNLYIIGTMNTADKSLALLDIALRRRFTFVPMFPNYECIEDEKSNLLKNLNDEISERKKSADYLIGHSYFMNDDEIIDILNLKILPLLLEYFNGNTIVINEILGSIKYELDKDNFCRSVKKRNKICQKSK